jgi:ubiquinone/menaquinone biosynthesis C-methylase UbiE
MSANEREAERILTEYARRERELGRDHYSDTRAVNLFLHQGQERALLEALGPSGLLPLQARSILEVGCGLGRWLGVFEKFGAERSRVAGIDLDPQRIAEATQRFPGMQLMTADATQIPWPDRSFDIVFQSLVFTSILDDGVRRAVASEMRRVLKPDGAILWYDFSYNNPRNPAVRKVSANEIKALFTDCDVDLARVSLAPPIARRLVERSWLAASVLERLKLLNTHYFGVIRPRVPD